MINNNLKRRSKLLIYFCTFIIIWVSLLFKTNDSDIYYIIKILPTIILIYFGSYVIINFGVEVLNINNCEEASESLKKDITEAKLYNKKNNLDNIN